jgi:flavin reductase (DIM6/NTAB) family NADH-FMN oxidoreductase RutF
MVDPSTYRDAMRNHAGAVAIITAGSPGNRTGLTATAVCSLSDDPPSLIVCVNRNASAYPIIKASRVFCVNLLAEDQHDIANCFAGRTDLKHESRFTVGNWTSLSTGAPALADAVANFDCQLFGDYDMKTHSIFIGHVRDVRTNTGADPLLYVRGNFGRVHPLASSPVG